MFSNRVTTALASVLATSFLVCLTPADQAEPQFSSPAHLPNIVLIAIDTLRSDHLGCYGYQQHTSPNIDALAEEGVVYENCYTAASWTFPSFVSLFTGLLPAAHGCTPDEAIPARIPLFPEQLAKRGYFCAAVVSNPVLSSKYGFSRGFDEYDDHSVSREVELGLLEPGNEHFRGEVRASEMITGAAVTRIARRLLRRATASAKPFFLFVHYFDPHDSYIPPAPYDLKFDPDYGGAMTGSGISRLRGSPPSGRDLQHLIARYDGEIAYEDSLIGELLQQLDQSSASLNTITVLVSDHGEAFAEHGKLLHGNSPYREEVHVPMIWRWPRVLPKGHRVTPAVSTIDIAVTLRDLLGLEDMGDLQGESLWPALVGRPVRDRRLIVSQTAMADAPDVQPYHLALTEGTWRVHVRFDQHPGAEGSLVEAYEISSDPTEQVDLIAENGRSEYIESIVQEAVRVWEKCKSLRHKCERSEKGPVLNFTQEELERIKALGYVQ